jgi:hypothetical protein
MPKARSTKQKPSLCARCGDRHLPPTGKKCTRSPKIATEPDVMDSDDSNDGMDQDTAAGGARLRQAGGQAKVYGEMHSYDSYVLSRLVTSVEALQARVFGSDDATCPPLPVNAIASEPSRPQGTGQASTVSHIPTLNQLRQDPTMMAQANSMVERVEAASLGAYGYNNKNLKRGVARAGGGRCTTRPYPLASRLCHRLWR